MSGDTLIAEIEVLERRQRELEAAIAEATRRNQARRAEVLMIARYGRRGWLLAAGLGAALLAGVVLGATYFPGTTRTIVICVPASK
jgi:hypothetical protein